MISSIHEDFCLFEEFQEGSQPALRRYFDHYGKGIHYLLERKIGKAAVGGTQEVFKTLFDHRKKIGSPAQLWDFLYSTAQEVASRYRQKGQDINLFKRLGKRTTTLSQKNEKRRVELIMDPDQQRAIEELTPRQQEVAACYRKGMRTREIADFLGIASQTVLNHKTHAIDRLKKAFGDQWGENNPFLA